MALAVLSALALGAAPTAAASNAWFQWPGKPSITLTVRVPDGPLTLPFEHAATAWDRSPVFDLELVEGVQCPAQTEVSVCVDTAGTHTLGNPAATEPTLLNGLGLLATIWVHEPWVAAATPAELDYMACHELGHALGLQHQSVPDSCMSYAFERPYPNARDYRTLGEMYGLPASTDPPAIVPITAAPVPVSSAPARAAVQVCAPGQPEASAAVPGAIPEVLGYGDARSFGSTGGVALTRPLVGMAITPAGSGYWNVASDGGIFAFGDARFHGSTGHIALNRPIVGMAATPSGNGYWLVASDGGIFAFGDARFHGSTGAIALAQPIVGMAATPSGNGYWLVASDGGIFAFGDARFHGSTGNIRLNQPIVAMAPTRSGRGYWLYAGDGGIFTFGDAPFLGSGSGVGFRTPVTGVAATPSGEGYWMVAADGTVAGFGDAKCYGSAVLDTRAFSVQSIVASPSSGGYWMSLRRSWSSADHLLEILRSATAG